MNKFNMQVTVIEFCLHLAEKYMAGSYDSVQWEEIDIRIDRQNLTVVEEQRVRDFVKNKREELFAIERAAKREENLKKLAASGKKLRFGFGYNLQSV